jgi:hypothetical protein
MMFMPFTLIQPSPSSGIQNVTLREVLAGTVDGSTAAARSCSETLETASEIGRGDWFRISAAIVEVRVGEHANVSPTESPKATARSMAQPRFELFESCPVDNQDDGCPSLGFKKTRPRAVDPQADNWT